MSDSYCLGCAVLDPRMFELRIRRVLRLACAQYGETSYRAACAPPERGAAAQALRRRLPRRARGLLATALRRNVDEISSTKFRRNVHETSSKFRRLFRLPDPSDPEFTYNQPPLASNQTWQPLLFDLASLSKGFQTEMRLASIKLIG